MTTRRKFLVASSGLAAMPWFSGSSGKAYASGGIEKVWTPLPQSAADELSVAPGFKWNLLAKTGDRISKNGARFGDCADYTAFLPGKTPEHGYLWVNHEAVTTTVLYGKEVAGKDKTKAMIDEEMKMVGGSFIELVREKSSGEWIMNADSTDAFRIDAHTRIPLVGIAGGASALGTVANCSGGLTPWGTVLTCEENFDTAWDAANAESAGWSRFYKAPLEDYGWVVEVDPKTKSGRKLTALGRFEHEGACVQLSADNHIVVYMGDDAKFQKLYKFVSAGKLTGNAEKDRDLLVEGKLYVANMGSGIWEHLSLENHLLKTSGKFANEREVMIRCREAATLVGGTPLSRPEGIAIDQRDGKIYVSLTNNDQAGDFHGSILVLSELGGYHSGSSFDFDVYFSGSIANGLACPDNLAVGPSSSLWVTTDVSGSKLGKSMYRGLMRNGLFRLDRGADGSVTARQFAMAPFDAELTGPHFHQNGQDLFFCVQHPGEYSFLKGRGYTSHWPGGGSSVPASGVVAVRAETRIFACVSGQEMSVFFSARATAVEGNQDAAKYGIGGSFGAEKIRTD